MRLRPIDGLRSALAGQAAPIRLGSRLAAWRRGFSSWSWLTYGLPENDPSRYLPDTASPRLAEVNGPIGRTVLRDKLLFAATLGSQLRVPAVLGVVDRGRIVALHERFRIETYADLLDYCSREGGVVLKPANSSAGRRVASLEVRDGQAILDKRSVARDDVRAFLLDTDGLLVTEMVVQAPYAANIFPDSVNTMRIVTMIDPSDGEPFVAAALHRFGTVRSAPTDNVSRGGLRADIDLDTGELGSLSASWTYEHGRFAHYSEHPDTGAPVEGVVVPQWREARDVVLAAVRRFGFLRYVGWDVVVSRDGVRVIEGNHTPDLATQRVNPYLGDPRIARFMRHNGVID